jgi:molybdenum cofactor synthesis domain-containing protein
MPRVAVVVIGNEILSGKVEDLNAKFAVRFLRDIGADLERIAVVPDTLAAIAAEVRACAAAFDAVLTSGGVGPTHDDITYEGVAAAFGVALEEDPRVARMLGDYFGAGLTDDHLRMARFPRGAEVHLGGGLPLPVVSVRNVYVFPGIPMLFEASLRALGEHLRGKPFFLSDVYCRRDEGAIAAALRRVQVAFADLALGSYPFRDAHGVFRVRITVEGRDEARVAEAARQVRAAVGAEAAG